MLAAGAWLFAAAPPPADALPSTPIAAPAGPSSYRIHAELIPRDLGLGERATYRGWVVVPREEAVRWVPPRAGGAFTWGRPAAHRVPAKGVAGRTPLDTVKVEIPLQIFALGDVAIPGIELWLPYVLPVRRESMRRLPTIHATVLPALAAADSNAELRPVRGPLSAPWWERAR
jgi:hypothetical protein